MKAQSISCFSHVSFELEEGQENDGTLNLLDVKDDLFFEWTPQNPASMIDSDLPASRFRIIVRLCEISEIIRRDESMKVVSLRFILRDSSRLPLFRFHSSPHALISHFIEFLIFKKLIQLAPSSPLTYETIIQFTTPPQCIQVTSFLTPHQAVAYTTHRRIFRELLHDAPPHISEESITEISINPDGTLPNFGDVRARVFKNGLSEKARRILWPYLLGVYLPSDTSAQIEQKRKKNLIQYKAIRDQWYSLIESQKKSAPSISELIRVIANDVKRTDRQLPQFKEDGCPNLVLLTNVLTAYAIFNRDTGYVQGMGDLVSPIIILYIQSWKDDRATIIDQGDMSRDEAEAFIFSMLVGLMETTQHDRMFTDLANRQEFAMERSLAIASSVHKPLQEWLHDNELSNLLFLYRPLLLLFKREFGIQIVFRLWDSFFSSEFPGSFPRVFLAALLIVLFPKLLLRSSGNLGDVMSITDNAIPEVDWRQVLQISMALRGRIEKAGAKMQWTLDSLPEEPRYRDFKPRFLNIFLNN